MTTFTVACVQLNTTDDTVANSAAVETSIRGAAKQGAEFIALPENAFCMQAPGTGAHPPADAFIILCESLARELGVWILIGSVHVATPEGKSWNRSLLLNPHGTVVVAYDKIHLFDVQLANGETYAESDRIAGGSKAVMYDAPWAKLGMTVCYDIRFPQLYRTLAKAGAGILLVPAAFTYTTGKAHWHTLLRARAIENGCFVIAPAQCGTHPGNRRTYGHSLVINPWGEIMAEGSEETPEIITAEIDTARIDEARAMIPSLTHDREFAS
jgi:predicted amidohydrolase